MKKRMAKGQKYMFESISFYRFIQSELRSANIQLEESFSIARSDQILYLKTIWRLLTEAIWCPLKRFCASTQELMLKLRVKFLVQFRCEAAFHAVRRNACALGLNTRIQLFFPHWIQIRKAFRCDNQMNSMHAYTKRRALNWYTFIECELQMELFGRRFRVYDYFVQIVFSSSVPSISIAGMVFVCEPTAYRRTNLQLRRTDDII